MLIGHHGKCTRLLNQPTTDAEPLLAGVGSLLGIGMTTGQAKWRKVAEILLAWISTVPCGALLAAIADWIV